MCEDNIDNPIHYTPLPTIVGDIDKIEIGFDMPDTIKVQATLNKTENYFTGTAYLDWNSGLFGLNEFMCWITTKNNIYDYIDKATIKTFLKDNSGNIIQYYDIDENKYKRLDVNSSFEDVFSFKIYGTKTYYSFGINIKSTGITKFIFDVYFYYEQTEIGKITFTIEE